MIISVWGIKTKSINNVSTKIYCYECDKNIIFDKKLTGYIVKYTCDNKNCKTPEKITITGTSSLYTSKWNNVNYQICRSCRSVKSEHEVKKNFIPWNVVKEQILKEGYTILTDEKEYDISLNKSQFKIKVKCPNDHIHHITWNNWNRGKRCRKCYEINKYDNAIKYKDGYDWYHQTVWSLTNKNYRKHKKIIDRDNKRGKKYHLDHMYSIYEGFKNNIPPFIIGSYINLKIIPIRENLKKQKNCSITKEKLLDEYFRKDW